MTKTQKSRPAARPARKAKARPAPKAVRRSLLEGPKGAKITAADAAAKAVQEAAPLWAEFSIDELVTLRAVLSGKRPLPTNSRRDALAGFVPEALKAKLTQEGARAILEKAKTPTQGPPRAAKNGSSKQHRGKADPVRRAAADAAKPAKPTPGAKAKAAKAKAAKAKPAKGAKRAKAAKPAAERAPRASHQAAIDAAKAGKMPTPPDFSSPSRERYRGKLQEVQALAKAKDVRGLRALEINPSCSGPAMIARYRDLCVMALTAKAK